MPIKKKINLNFFKKWSPQMAYVLGFFAADGCMIKNNRGAHFIEFHITDREVLSKIKKVMNSDHKIAVRLTGPKHKTGYRLQIGSKEIYNDLLNLGFTPAKSLDLGLPDLPEKVFADFVRGYFDGDGCVYFKQHFRKDRGKFGWFFTSRFTCGNRDFLEKLHTKLGKFGLRGYIYKKQRSGYELVYSRKDSLALFKFMYNNVARDLFLTRKYVKFKKAIITLYGINAVVA